MKKVILKITYVTKRRINIQLMINNTKEILLNALLIRDIMLIKTTLMGIHLEGVENRVQNQIKAMMSINQNMLLILKL